MRTASDAITAPSAYRAATYRAATVSEPPRYRAATVRERSANGIATIECITQPEQIPFT